MSRALTPGLIASPRVAITRTRELPVPGEVLVTVGDRVKASDVVAQAELSGDLYILRLPERMGLEVAEVLSGLQVKQGDTVSEGQVICTQSGLFGMLTTEFRAPEAGAIEFIAETTGHVGLRLPPKRITIDAYVSGEVTRVTEGKSVQISNESCFIQGIFGVGGERKGEVHFLEVAPDAKLTGAEFGPALNGKVCIGGSSPSYEALLAAAEAGVRGLVCGSVDDKVLAQFLGYELGIALTGDEDIPFTMIITEGFGDLGLSQRVLQALEGLQGAQASLNGKTQVRAGAVRPELIVEIANQSKAIEESLDLHLRVGARVRLIRVPYFGEFAEVVELPIAEQQIPTGAKTRVLLARLSNGEVVTVPRANVELV